MKQFYFVALLLAMHFQTFSQLNNGGLNASFGVDADTKAGYLKYGPVTGTVSSDDWFSSSTASGSNVIDTSNASDYRSLLQAGKNIRFTKRMSVPYYSTVNGTLWLDALYSRDYIETGNALDSTTFTGGRKNGDDPFTWAGITSSIPEKTDLVDGFAHMRRNGSNATDSLWIFTGTSTKGVAGSRYFDIELYKNRITYNSSTGAFSTGGPDAGHVQWVFDASGNITQTGDLIVAVSYTAGVPTVEVRIWVSKTTYDTVSPLLFNFGSSFDGGTSSFGYATIISKTGTTAFGSGIANISATPAADTTYATPWGTHGISGSVQWASQYRSLQFIEIGLNLTRMGLDPELYQINSGICHPAFSSLFFKSRSSHSFTSNLQDFMGPFDFLHTSPDYSITYPTLSCSNTTGTISIQNNSGSFLTFSTSDGNITSSSTNSIQVNKPGSYTIQAAIAPGCPVRRTDVVTVALDTFPPVASFYGAADYDQFILHGGDTALSNYNTPFGGSQGLLWNWSGPNGFTDSVQNPRVDNTSGNYRLILTEKRNGCSDTISNQISFAVLSVGTSLKAEPVNNSVLLRWNMIDKSNVVAFDIERSSNGSAFEKVGSATAAPANTHSMYSFTDNNVPPGNIVYRLKIMAAGRPSSYSNLATVNKSAGQSCVLAGTSLSANPRLIVNTTETIKTKVMVCNSAGQTVYAKQVVLPAGQNNIELPVNGRKNRLHIVSLFIDNKLQFSGKVIF